MSTGGVDLLFYQFRRRGPSIRWFALPRVIATLSAAAVISLRAIVTQSGLPIKLAKLAKMKEYNESFKFLEGPEKRGIICKMADEAGLKIVFGGRYFNIIGKNNGKGRAVKILTRLFKKEFGRVQTIGIGDNLNDISRFLLNKERLVLSGTTDNFNNVDKIKGIIESSQMFRTVNISSAAADKKDNRVKFKFIIEM